MVPKLTHSFLYPHATHQQLINKECAKGLLTIGYRRLLENSEREELVTWKLRRYSSLYKIKSSGKE